MIRNAYIVPGLVDGAVVLKQAEDRARDKRHPESTSVHYHDQGGRCNNKCILVKAKKTEETK